MRLFEILVGLVTFAIMATLVYVCAGKIIGWLDSHPRGVDSDDRSAPRLSLLPLPGGWQIPFSAAVGGLTLAAIALVALPAIVDTFGRSKMMLRVEPEQDFTCLPLNDAQLARRVFGAGVPCAELLQHSSPALRDQILREWRVVRESR